MLPVTTKDKAYKPGFRIKERIGGWFRLIFSDKNSRNLFMFLLINLSMAFVELAYGIITNSLGLISDSFHMFFDCTALLAGLVATLIARWRANDKFSYGYVRAETIAGFVNALFLLFIAFFIFSEAVERIFEPPHVEHERLMVVSIAGFIVNIIGIFAFAHGGGHHGHSHGGGGHGHSHGGGHGHSHDQPTVTHRHSHEHHGHSHENPGDHGHAHSHTEAEHKTSQNQIMQGVFLHILADTLGSVGVILSSFLMQTYGWMIADPVCSLFIAILVGFSVIPLLRDSVGILMQRQPKELDDLLPGCYNRVSQLDGVYSVHETHFWTLCSDNFVGCLKVEVAADADSKYISSQTHNIFTAIGVKQLFVQIDKVAG